MTKKLGEYCVGSLRFINKYDALVFATKTNQSVEWCFNDEVFSCFDWSMPISESIDELYKQRAQQIRDKYDYVSLFFSGGIDSANILHAFIDNNILLDEIVMFKPKCYKHNPLSTIRGTNPFSELEFAALPHLQKYADGKGIKIRTIYFEDATNNLLNNYADQFYKLNYLAPNSISRVAIAVTDAFWNDLYDKGKNVGHIQGVDKPCIIKENDSYYFFFYDYVNTFVFDCAEKTELSEKIAKHQHHELFYWTPDLPRLVIKQAQIAKQVYMLNPTKSFNINSCLEYLYKPHVLSIRELFYDGKTGWSTNSIKQQWINTPELSYVKGIFTDMLALARSSISEQFTDIDPLILGDRPRAGSYKTIASRRYLL